MKGTHDLLLVGLSVAVAIFASYTALDLADRVTAARGAARSIWLAGGSFAMGVGIWSMHFIGMLAFKVPGMPIAYDVPLWLLSLSISIAASLLALAVASRSSVDLRALFAAGLVMGAAIAGMHYTGMAAMRIGGGIEYEPWLVTGSVAVAIVASLAALRLAFSFRAERGRGARWGKVIGAVAMGLAITGMHYTGMAAVRITPSAVPLHVQGDELLASGGLALPVIVGTLAILSITVATAFLDRRLRARLEEAEEVRRNESRFRALVAATTQMVWVADECGSLLPDQGHWGDFTGQSAQEYRGCGWLDAVHPDDREVTAESWAAAVGHGTVFRVEHRLRRRDGTYRHFSVRGVPVLQPDGRVREWVGTHTDITDQIHAQDEREFLDEATQALASSLDYDETLATVARLAVVRLADWCGVDVLRGDEVVRVAIAHRDPAKEAIASELRRYPFDPDASGGSPRAIRTGASRA